MLGEFFWVATRRLNPPLTPAEAERTLTNYARSWQILDVTGVAVLEAVRAAQRHQLAFWDALIWATAKLNAVATVLTEDLPGARLIEGVRFDNPLDSAFDLARLD